MEVLNWFGPPLVKLSADPDVVAFLNHYADQILSKEKIPDKIDFTKNLLQLVYGSFELKKGFHLDVERYLERIGKDFVQKFSHVENPELVDVRVSGMWCVSHPKHIWSSLHSHVGDITGVIYLKMPEVRREGFPEQYENVLTPAGISFTQGTPGRFHKAVFTVEPIVGDVLLFPSGLIHTVYPFFGPDERRSFSFNLRILPKKTE